MDKKRAAMPRASVRFLSSTFRRRNSSICAGASTRRGGHTRTRLRISRKACSWRRCRRSRNYWGTDYDWRKCEAKLNAIPQFLTEIDGQDIHFIHVRSKHENALPLIITHGWPGSIIEQMKVIGPLTDPTAHGASASDAFHLVIPSIPGYGYSPEPTTLGWDPVRIAKAWVVLMERLGYTQFVAQGGDWGATITQAAGFACTAQVLGIHTNMPGTVPADILAAAKSGAPAPAGLAGDELHAFEQLSDFYAKHLGYAVEMANRPQTLYGLTIRRLRWQPGFWTTTRTATR